MGNKNILIKFYTGLLFLGAPALSQQAVDFSSVQAATGLQPIPNIVEPVPPLVIKMNERAIEYPDGHASQIVPRTATLDDKVNSYSSIGWSDNRGIWKVESQGNPCVVQATDGQSNSCQ